jgi:hypothetical protein
MSRRAALSLFMTASNLANSVTRSASMCFPPALKWTNCMPAPRRLRSALTSPTARNEAALTRTTISVRTPKSMGRVVSTQHPPRLRSSIFPGTKMPSDGRRLILASPPHLNRVLRRRWSSPHDCRRRDRWHACRCDLRHAYKIVCRAKTLEHGSNVTPGWKPK